MIILACKSEKLVPNSNRCPPDLIIEFVGVRVSVPWTVSDRAALGVVTK
jgi:hypothetical protein